MPKLLQRLVTPFLIGMLLTVSLGYDANAQILPSPPILIVNKSFCQWDPVADPTPQAGNLTCVAPTSPIKQSDRILFDINIKNNNNFDVNNIVLTENLPPDFRLVDANCAPSTLTITSNNSTVPLVLTFDQSDIIAANTEINCVVYGYFAGKSANSSGDNQALVSSTDPNGNPVNGRDKESRNYEPDVAISDLAVEKTHQLISPNSTFTPTNQSFVVEYSIKVTNLGTQDLYLADFFQIHDHLYRNPVYQVYGAYPATPEPVTAKIVPGTISCTSTGNADCVDLARSGGTDQTFNLPNRKQGSVSYFGRWVYPTASLGSMPAGASFTLKFQVIYETVVSCFNENVTLDQPIINEVSIDFDRASGVHFNDAVSANNVSKDSLPVRYDMPYDPNCSFSANPTPPPPSHSLKVSKTELNPTTTAANPLPWGSPITYRIRLENAYPAGTAPANLHDIDIVSLRDIVQIGSALPFQAQFVSAGCVAGACLPAISGTSTANATITGLSGITMYNSNTGFSIPPNGFAEIDITFVYDPNPGSCDISPRNRAMQNLVEVNYKYVNKNQIQRDNARTYLPSYPACEFLINKNWVGLAPTQLKFNTPYEFELAIENNASFTRKLYTIFDKIRVTNANYGNLPFKYKFQCTPSVGVTGLITLNNPNYPNYEVAGSMGYNQLVTSGSAIFNNISGPSGVSFPPNSQLKCSAWIEVSKPSQLSSGCLADGSTQIQNAFYISEIYNFSPRSGNQITSNNTALASTTAPQCYEFVVNKRVSQSSTNSYGPSLTYTIEIENPSGDTGMLAPPNAWVLEDVFTNPFYNNNISLVSVSLPSADWDVTPNNPQRIEFYHLPAGITTVTYQLNPNFPTSYIENDVGIKPQGTVATEWFNKNPNQLTDYEVVEVTVVDNSGQICISKYNDLNGNGVFDQGEPPLAGAPFVIRDQQGNLVVAGALTDANGKFCTARILPTGVYEVEEFVPSSWVNTDPGTFPPVKTVNITSVSQIGLVAFGNTIKTAALKLCKDVDPNIPFGTNFDFQLQPGGRVSVPAGSCKLVSTQLKPGDSVIVTEPASNGYLLKDIHIEPASASSTVLIGQRKAVVTMVAGVNEVTFENEYKPSFIEICKESDVAGMMDFIIHPAPQGTISVPANGCSAPIEVPAGYVTITEDPASLIYPVTDMVGGHVLPGAPLVLTDTTARSITIDAPVGGLGTQTIVTFENKYNGSR